MLEMRHSGHPILNTQCGKGEIRTLDTLSGMPLFESGAFNHSATFPNANVLYQSLLAFGKRWGYDPKVWRPSACVDGMGG